MIAVHSRCEAHNADRQHVDARFLQMLPAIRRQASIACWHLGAEQREEVIAAVVANTFVAFRRLVERGRLDVARPTPLASYAIKQIRAGRCVGCRLNVRDITSRYCQRAKGVRVHRLGRFDSKEHQWREIVAPARIMW